MLGDVDVVSIIVELVFASPSSFFGVRVLKAASLSACQIKFRASIKLRAIASRRAREREREREREGKGEETKTEIETESKVSFHVYFRRSVSKIQIYHKGSQHHYANVSIWHVVKSNESMSANLIYG